MARSAKQLSAFISCRYTYGRVPSGNSRVDVVPMNRALDRSTVLVALIVSAAGHVVHNLAEFQPSILFGWETLFPLGVTVLVGAGLIYRPGRIVYAVSAGWALIVLVVGGGSVVPFAFLPFVPEQSASHYLAHLVYALTQVPLVWVGIRGVRAASPTDGAPVTD